MKRVYIVIFITWLLISHNAPVQAQRAFKCVDENGAISYQRKPCKKTGPSMLEDKGITDNKSYRESLVVVSDQLQQYTVSVLGFNWWQVSSQKVNKKLLHVKFSDTTGDSKMTLMIDFLVAAKETQYNQSKLKDLLVKKSRQVIAGSVEKRPTLVNIRTQGVLGIYSSFKDATLADEVNIPDGEYRFNTQGIMYTKGVLINFTLLSNDLSSENHRSAMNFMTRGVTVKENK